MKTIQNLEVFGLLLLILTGHSFASSNHINPETKERILTRVSHLIRNKAFAFDTDFDRWPEILQSHRKAIDSASTVNEFEEALDLSFDAFEISHLYITPPKIKASDSDRSIRRLGINGPNTKTGISVTHVSKESPAAEAGIRKLDTITSINGAWPARLNYLKGIRGEHLTIEWTRQGESMSGEIICRPFTSTDLPWIEWPSPNVAVIHIQGFTNVGYKMLTISSLFRQASRAQAIIIDLRNNYGGYLHNALHLAGKVLNREQIFALHVTRKHYSNFEYEVDFEKQTASSEAIRHSRKLKPTFSIKRYKGKLAVLVDGYSASAADIFPAAIQEHQRGLVIGTHSSGALIGSRVARLPDGYHLTYPFVELLTSQGHRLESNGVVPDIELGWQETANDAIIYKRAIQALLPKNESLRK